MKPAPQGTGAYAAMPDATLAYVVKSLEQRLAGLDPTASMIQAALHGDYLTRLTAAREELARRGGSHVTRPGRSVLRRRG